MIVLKNDAMAVEIGRQTGRMEKLKLNRADFGQWNIIPGRLEISDDLQRICFREGRDACNVEILSEEQSRIIISKRFEKAAFVVREEWSINREEVHWKVQLELDAGVETRSVKISQMIPWPTAEPYKWNVWTAKEGFPKSATRVGNSKIVYGDLCYGTTIPELSIFNANFDVGLSIAKPLGLKIPRWEMNFSGYRGGGVNIDSGFLKLSEQNVAETNLMLHPHEGCWRPGLGWLVDKFPDYFKAGLPDAAKRVDGGFLIGNPSTTKEQMRIARSYGAKVAEMHHHYRYYGCYFPDEKSWRTTEGNPVREHVRKDERSVAAIRNSIENFRDNEIAPLLYIQLAGDGYKPYVEKEYPESIVLNTDGQKMGQTYYNVWMMNSDPSLPFGRAIRNELEKFFELYPEAGGLFWDQAGYDDIDSAHHDGITMVENKPMYRLAFCYEKHRDLMVAEAHRRGMIVAANGLAYIELGGGIDQIMAEGSSWLAELVQYECVTRPMLFYHYFKDENDLEEMFQKCLVAGATGYSVPDCSMSPDMDMLFRAYAPLVDMLSGRKWLFEPYPLELPPGVNGNIFTMENNNLNVTLVATGQSLLLTPTFQPLTVKVRSKKTADIQKIIYSGISGMRTKVSWEAKDNGTVIINIPEHSVAGVLEISIN